MMGPCTMAKTVHKCSICTKEFAKQKILKEHLRRHTMDKRYLCSVCGKGFVTSGHRNRHTKIHYRQVPSSTGSEASAKCPTALSSRSVVPCAAHLNGTRRSANACGTCEKVFDFPSKLKRHMRLHTGEKPYECTKCERTFNRQYSLSIHMRIHEKSRPYVCASCQKTFYAVSHLSRHIRTHLPHTQRQHECARCGKKCRDKWNMQTHMKSHGGDEKAYKCSTCHKTFHHSSHRARHQKTHMSESKYTCHYCSKSFKLKEYLQSHMLSHIKAKSFTCHLCAKMFGHKQHLNRHIKNVHKSM